MDTTRAAAFFDLDKTLIEGSSAVHFARAAYRSGMRSRREIAGDLYANLKFRFRGSTDEETDALRDAVLQALAGQREVDLHAAGPGRAGRDPAADLHRGAGGGLEPHRRRPARLHRHRRQPRAGRDAGRRCWR